MSSSGEVWNVEYQDLRRREGDPPYGGPGDRRQAAYPGNGQGVSCVKELPKPGGSNFGTGLRIAYKLLKTEDHIDNVIGELGIDGVVVE